MSQNNSHFKKRKRWKIGGKVGKKGKNRIFCFGYFLFKGLKLLPHFLVENIGLQNEWTFFFENMGQKNGCKFLFESIGLVDACKICV
jgi:hypothetical protein